MDDIFIFAKTLSELEENTKLVLQRLRENDLYLKPVKCEFAKTKIEWLGMVIEEGQITMDLGKLKGIQDWPTPNSGIRKFLSKIHLELFRAGKTRISQTVYS